MLDEESPFERIMRESKKRIHESEKERTIQQICGAIGDRRTRDLLDILGRIESHSGWNTAIEYLITSAKNHYPVPAGLPTEKRLLEPIKYREVIFELFECSGLEPVNLGTDLLLNELTEAKSYPVAKSQFMDRVEALTHESIKAGDTLFFETGFLPSKLNESIGKEIELSQLQSIEDTIQTIKDSTISLSPFWHSEHSRKALAELGIHESKISRNRFLVVLSVLQITSDTRERILQSLDNPTEGSTFNGYTEPTHEMYKILLESIMTCNVETLRNLGSRHACPTYNHLLRTYVDRYRSTGSSSDFRDLLLSIRDHVTIRWVDSIIAISELVQLPEQRVMTAAIRALGNYYHASTTSTLLDIFCITNNRSMRRSILQTISHLNTRCPETKDAVYQAMHQDCTHLEEISRFYKHTWKK